MKKLLTGFLVGFVAGLVLGAVNWRSLAPFANTTYGVASPDLTKYDLAHFGTGVPEYSSRHFLFRTGFGDVDEYWSFVLPPDHARAFLDSYTRTNSLPAAARTIDFPVWIKPSYAHKDWRSGLWFESFSDLSEVYYRKSLFCGYCARKHRIYLMNWND